MNLVKKLILISVIIAPANALAATIESAEAATTKNDIFAVRDALKFYHREYGRYPLLTSREILSILVGGNNMEMNSKEIVFWESRSDKTFLWITTRKGNLDESGELLDGWGRPVIIISDPKAKTIAAWSRGPDGNWDRVMAEKRNYYWKLEQ